MVRKLLIGFTGLVVLAVVGVLVGPSFINWNSYKTEIADQVKSITGRDLVIGGDIQIAVLPAPAIVANDVTFANVEGGSDSQMVRLGSLAVNVALGPLLGGDIQITKVRLVDPVVVLEVLADGQQNWIIEGLKSDDAAALANGGTKKASIDLETGQAVTEDGPNAAGPGLQLDNFEIVNGTVIYRDAASAVEERVADLNATFKAVSLNGPFESIGSLTVRGVPLSYELGVDGVFQGRTVPINVLLRSDGVGASVGFNGNIVDLSGDAKFTGNLKAEGQSLAAMLAAISPGNQLPGGLNQSFSAEGDVTATASHIEVGTLAVKLGDTSASGTASVDLAETIQAAADFTINHINLDRFLAFAPYSGNAPAKSTEADGTLDAQPDTALTAGSSEGTVGQTAQAAVPLTIPDAIGVSLALGVDAITFQGEKAGPVRVNVELANGEITLSQFSSQLPGATDVAMFGFVSMQDGAPVFDGEAEISVGDTRRLSRWLQVDLPDLPNGRLRHVKARANVKASTESVQISGIDVTFDRSHLTGGVTVALRKRLAFGASFELDRLDLEGYLPLAGEPSDTTGTAVSGDAGETVAETIGAEKPTPVATPNPLTVLTALTKFDANFKARIGEIIHQGTPIRKMEFDGTLFNGALTVKKASVADLAGASVSLAGAMTELGGNPRFGDLKATFKAKSVQKLAGLLAVDLPVPAKALGAVSMVVTLDGPVLQPSLKGSGSAAGLQGAVDGTLSMLPLTDMVDATVTLKHGNVAKLLRTLGVSYRPSGNIGGLDVSTRISGGADRLKLENLAGSLGAVKFQGETTVRLNGLVPKISATIQTNEFTVDPFLPVQKTASVSQQFGVVARPILTAAAPWPDDPLDLSALNGLNGDFRIQSDAINYQSYHLKEAEVIATLNDGILKADRITALMFGGRVNVKGLLNAQQVPSVDATVSFENASISNMLSALLGTPTAAGVFTFETALNANGSSVADMVAALDGGGSFALKGLDVQGSAKGTAFAGVLGLVQSFGQLGAGLTGKSADGLADATGSFSLNDGIAQIGDFKLMSGFGNGSATGTIDLSRWQMDISGAMKMAQNLLGELLTQKAGIPLDLPFRVSGALDSPTVTLETASLGSGGGGSVLPGLDKLEEKVPGLGGLLQGVLGGALGGGAQQQPVPTQQQPPSQTGTQAGSQTQGSQTQGTPVPQSQPEPQQAPAQQQLKPEDVLKQIFKF